MKIAHLTTLVLAAALTATTATAPAGATTVSRCYAPNLSLHIGPPSGAAGTSYYHVVLTNTGAVSCTLTGYPGVSARKSLTGSRIGHAATRNTVDAVTTVTLAPGGKAHAVLGIAAAGNYSPAKCRPKWAHAVAVYPPGAFDRLARPLDFETCARRAIHILSVTTVTKGA